MKALIRNKNEMVRYCDGIEGIDWKTGAPLTNQEWAGGPYSLVTDYVEDCAESQPIQSTPSAEQDSVDLTETVTYGGKEYTLEELKKLIG